MKNEKTLGQIAFEAYNESKGGLTYDGKPIPPWHELSGDRAAVHRAWEVAAVAAVEADIAKAGPYDFIGHALRSLPKAGGREVALVRTKLDEAAMWFARVPVESPR